MAKKNLSAIFGNKDLNGLRLSKHNLTDDRKSALDTYLLGVAGKNLFNTSNVVDGEVINNAGGNIFAFAGWARSGRIAVSAATTYTLSGVYAVAGSSFAIRFENSSNGLISYMSNTTTGIVFPFTFTTPSGCAFLVFTIRQGTYPATLAEAAATIQLESGPAASAYETFQKTFPQRLSENYDIVITGGKNLFNSALGTDGFFVENNGGVFSSALYGYTDYIKVIPGRTYSGWDGLNGMRKTCYYNASKQNISTGSTNNITTFTVPEGVAWVRVSYYAARKASFQFEQSASPTAFESYSASKTLVSINGAVPASVGAASATKIITLAMIERVILAGDSYNAQYNTLPGKGSISLLSAHSDWNFENYSKSGDSYDKILTRIRTNNGTYKSTGIKTFTGGGFVICISFTNDNNDGWINSADQLNVYVEKLKKVISAFQALGFKPIIATEYHNISGTNGAKNMQAVLSEVAGQYGAVFCDVYEKARFLRGTDVSWYWDGSHPGVRTNSLFWTNILPYIEALPRPKWGIKVFRKRDSVSVTTIADLIYGSIEERVLKFKEILVTQQALTQANYSFYDNQPGITGQSPQTVGEYLDLLAGNSVAMGTDYALIEFIVNATSARTKTLKLFVGNTSATVYVKDVIQGTWVAITNTGGYVTLTDLQSQMDFDKVSLLLFNSGGFSIIAPSIEFTGEEEKGYWIKPLPRDFRSAELLTNPLVTTLTGWTTTGTVTPAAPADANKPTGVTNIVTLTSSNSLKQTVTFSSADYKRRAQIKILARWNPARYDSGNTFPTGAPITLDTYDSKRVKVQIINSTSTATFYRRIDLHWTEAVIEIDVAANDTAFDLLVLRDDSDIEFAKASVKIE